MPANGGVAFASKRDRQSCAVKLSKGFYERVLRRAAFLVRTGVLNARSDFFMLQRHSCTSLKVIPP